MTYAAWRKSSDNGGNCVEVANAWRKSSYSGDNGGDCVEVAEAWRKSTRSGDNGGACVEVAHAQAMVAVRDSKDPDGPRLSFTPEAWTAFTGRITRSGANSA